MRPPIHWWAWASPGLRWGIFLRPDLLAVSTPWLTVEIYLRTFSYLYPGVRTSGIAAGIGPLQGPYDPGMTHIGWHRWSFDLRTYNSTTGWCPLQPWQRGF